MKGSFTILSATLGLVALLVAACAPTPTGGAPTAAPTAAPKQTEPTKPASTQPTTAPTTAAPTAAPAKTTTFPERGRAITIIIPYAAGGSTDVSTRVLAPLLEKELGVPVQVVNKPGASSQVGMTEAAAAKPDGYTIVAVVLPGGVVPYLDPERKATYTRRSFISLGNQWYVPSSISVRADSPYKSVTELVEAARANPGRIKVGTTGLTASSGLAYHLFANLSKVQFAAVHFDGAGPAVTALLGGHIDAAFTSVSNMVPHVKAGKVRVLGIADREESPLVPGVPTLASQGFPVYLSVYGGLAVPAGTPKGAVDVLSAALKKAVESEEHKKKMEELGQGYKYMTPEEFEKLWAEQEEAVRPLIPMLKVQ